MIGTFQQRDLVLGMICLLVAIPAAASVNKSISIDDGATADGASSVNGSVTVGSDATITGRLSTVNGKITIGDGAVVEDARTVNGALRIGHKVTADDLETVNGSIRLESDSRIDGSVSAVNGSIRVDKGGRIERDLSNVNGDIEIDASEIGGSLSTVSGDVELADGAVIKGDLVVEKPGKSGWFNKDTRVPTVIVGPGCRVEGTLRLKREVKLYISESATVGAVEGVMSMDDAIRFSGDRP